MSRSYRLAVSRQTDDAKHRSYRRAFHVPSLSVHLTSSEINEFLGRCAGTVDRQAATRGFGIRHTQMRDRRRGLGCPDRPRQPQQLARSSVAVPDRAVYRGSCISRRFGCRATARSSPAASANTARRHSRSRITAVFLRRRSCRINRKNANSSNC